MHFFFCFTANTHTHNTTHIHTCIKMLVVAQTLALFRCCCSLLHIYTFLLNFIFLLFLFIYFLLFIIGVGANSLPFSCFVTGLARKLAQTVACCCRATLRPKQTYSYTRRVTLWKPAHSQLVNQSADYVSWLASRQQQRVSATRPAARPPIYVSFAIYDCRFFCFYCNTKSCSCCGRCCGWNFSYIRYVFLRFVLSFHLYILAWILSVS